MTNEIEHNYDGVEQNSNQPDAPEDRGPDDKIGLVNRHLGLMDELHLLAEIEGESVEDVSLVCPGCQETLCQITADSIDSIEAVCPGCETPLFAHNTLVAPHRLGDEVKAKEAHDFLISRWEHLLEQKRREQTYDQPSPQAFRSRKVDQVKASAKEYEMAAHDFGWGWSPEVLE